MVPSFVPQAETPASQEKGGVEVTVTPVAYQPRLGSTVSERETWRGMTRTYTLHGMYDTPTRQIDRVATPTLDVWPGQVAFLVTVRNKQPRVFRMAGAVIQFQVSGHQIGVDQAGYGELLQAIVPPRQQEQFTIYGPPLASLPPSTNVALFVYDVPTATDSAGNITEKQNFEWYFGYSTRRAEQQAVVHVERKVEAIGPSVVVPQTKRKKSH